MLNSIHLLTTYACNFACDHCFLYCSPSARGTFTLEQIVNLLDQITRIASIDAVCFEGGEPLLYYPLVLEGIDQARRRGLKGGIVTNAFWATSQRDAELWLRGLLERGVTAVTVSDDALHYGDAPGAHIQRVTAAAEKLGMTARNICTDRPTVVYQPAGTGGQTQADGGPANPPGGAPADQSTSGTGGQPVVAGGVKFRGRAVEKLAAGLPRRPWEGLTRCPHEDLRNPKRVHADCYGHLHLCQGLLMGNFWQRPLEEIVAGYDPDAHPIVGPLLAGGPAQLAREFGLAHEDGYVDECHMCFAMRLALLDRFGQLLAPRQVYGLT